MIGVVFLLVALSVFLFYLNDSDSDRRIVELKSYGFELQKELILASQVHEGYERTIFIPDHIEKHDFKINNTERVLILTSEDTDFPFPIPKTTGLLSKGNNIIKNVGGEVVIG